jgi:hypothetical protein
MLAALLLVLAIPAAAGDCWVKTLENKVTGHGDATTGKHYAALRQALVQAEAVQRADAAINAIRNVRYQVHRYIGTAYHPGAPLSGESAIYLHKPDAWAGSCGLKPWADTVHFASLEVEFNNLRALEGPADGGGGLADTRYFHEPEITARRDGYPVYEGRVLVLTAGNLPPLVPVTLGEYLDAWQRTLQAEREQSRADGQAVAQDPEWKSYIGQLRKTDPKAAAELQQSMDDAARMADTGDAGAESEWAELQRLRKSLGAAQRTQPVYLSADALERHRFGYARPGAEGARKLAKVNPALWAGRRSEQTVRVVTLEVFLNRSEVFAGDDDADQAAARSWLERVDVKPYLALFEGQP